MSNLEEAKEFIKGKKWKIFKPIIVSSLIVTAIAFILILVFNITNDNSMKTKILSAVINLIMIPMTFGIQYYYLNMIREKEYNIGMLFNYYKDIKTSLKMILISIIVAIAIYVGTLLLIIPGIILSMQLFFYQQVYIDNEANLTVSELFTKCREMMNGHKLELFKFHLLILLIELLIVFAAGYIPVVMKLPYLALILCIVAFIWLIPCVIVATLKFYEKIK